MQKFSADFIFSSDGQFISDQVIITDDQGMILSLDNAQANHDPASVKYLFPA
jgi:hypothetical protein